MQSAKVYLNLQRKVKQKCRIETTLEPLKIQTFIYQFTFEVSWMNQAVNYLTFDVKKGEIFGLIGPNGSVKRQYLTVLHVL
jgi:ABC-type multidrug transport system ATPase subunit